MLLLIDNQWGCRAITVVKYWRSDHVLQIKIINVNATCIKRIAFVISIIIRCLSCHHNSTLTANVVLGYPDSTFFWPINFPSLCYQCCRGNHLYTDPLQPNQKMQHQGRQRSRSLGAQNLFWVHLCVCWSLIICMKETKCSQKECTKQTRIGALQGWNLLYLDNSIWSS